MKEMTVGIQKSNEYKCPVCNADIFDEWGEFISGGEECEHTKFILSDIYPCYISDDVSEELKDNYACFCDDDAENEPEGDDIFKATKRHADWLLDSLKFASGKKYEVAAIKEVDEEVDEDECSVCYCVITELP